MMPTPIYRPETVKPAYHLRYTWTGWPTAGTSFPPIPDEQFFETLDLAWHTDHLRRISTNWEADRIQFTFSTVPTVFPTLFVGRVKGRLQHAFRQAETPVKFSRKVAFRGIGENDTDEVENYISRQVENESFVDARFEEMLERFTKIDETVSLGDPIPSNSGRYWYNLHVVFVVADRRRLGSPHSFSKIDRAITSGASKHGYAISVRSLMPDHVHLALRGNIERSPQEIALSLMNNTAYAMGHNAIWQHGYYVGSFSEYDVGAVHRG